MTIRTNWQRLDDGSWGVKLQGRDVGRMTGHTVDVTNRAGKHSRVKLGRRVMQWNAGRSAVYQAVDLKRGG
jgi:hypothetical protein